MDNAVTPADLKPLRKGVADYVRNSSWLLLEHAIRLVVGLLVGVQVARHLGPLQFGNLSYALAIVSIAASLARLGLDSIVVSRLVKTPAAGGTILRTALGLRLIGAGGAFSLICLLLPWMSSVAAERIYIVIIAAGLLFQTADVVDFLYQARVRNGRTAALRMGQILVSAGLRLFLIWNDAGLLAFVIVTLADQILLATAYAMLMRKQRDPIPHRFDPQLARALVAEAGPLLLSGVFVAAYVRIDQILVQHLLGPEDIGHYVAATNLSEMLYFVPTLVASAVFPALVTTGAEGAGLPVRLRRLLYRGLLLFGIVIAATTSLLAPQLIDLLYGPRFAPAAEVLAIHVWTLVFVAYAGLFGKVLIAQGQQRILPLLTLIGLATDVACLWLLVPTQGLRGAAQAAVMSHVAIVMALLALHGPARTDLADALWFGKRGDTTP